MQQGQKTSGHNSYLRLQKYMYKKVTYGKIATTAQVTNAPELVHSATSSHQTIQPPFYHDTPPLAQVLSAIHSSACLG